MQKHIFQRVRHETRRRSLTVASLSYLTPRMLRVGFTSPDLHDFVSPGADDHTKLFFPTLEGGVAMRDFTPRAFDNAQGALVIDFALHESGPATEWASRAAIGDGLQIGGPRGSTLTPADFDWYWLVGDETALPAIARQLEGLAPGTPADVFAIVASQDEVMTFEAPAALTQTWIVRDGGGDAAAQLRAAMDRLALPSGDGFVWIAAEGGVARTLRQHMIEARGHPREWMKAAGYWARGKADGGGRIEDEPPSGEPGPASGGGGPPWRA
jgi:NADPH-dependent ferric siderophore reductase